MIKPQIIERQQVPEDVPLELLQSLELLPPSKMQFSIEGRQEYRKSKKEYTDYLLQGVTYRKYVINGASLSLIDKNVPLIPQEFLDEIWEKCGGSKDGRKSAMARSLIKIKKG